MEHLREVNLSEAKAFAQHHGMVDAIETSAKENTNIEELFMEMAKVNYVSQHRKVTIC